MLPPPTPAARRFGSPTALAERTREHAADDERALRLLQLSTELDLLEEERRVERHPVLLARLDWDITRLKSEIVELGEAFRTGGRS